MTEPDVPALADDFARDPAWPPDYLFPQSAWSGLGGLDDLRFLERRLAHEQLIPLSYVRLRERLAFALLTMDMQNRWQRAWEETGARNRAALTALESAARAASATRVLALGALDALCTLYPDPAVRPTEHLQIVAENEAHLLSSPTSEIITISRRPSALPANVGIERLFSHARPALEMPPPAYSGLFVTQDAPRLTRDATRTAQEAAQPDAAPRPRARGQGPKDEPMAAPPPRFHDLPNLLLMRREHALLLSLLDWSARPAETRVGLLVWEITEMTRRWTLDWSWFVEEARAWGVHGVVSAALDEIHEPWRSGVPPQARAALAPGPVGRWLTRTLGPRAAQSLLGHPLLRRL